MEDSYLKTPGVQNNEALFRLRNAFEKSIAHGFLIDQFVDYFGEESREIIEALNLPYDIMKYAGILYDHEIGPDKTLVPSKPRYLMAYTLGGGGMANIACAVDMKMSLPDLIRWVAVKIPKHKRSNNPPLWNRFKRETKVMASLPHGFAPTVYNLVEGSDYQFMIMDLIDGENEEFLDLFISKHSVGENFIELENIWKFTKSLYEKVSFLGHEGSHRDIEPSNIIITNDYNAKLNDFGIARNVVGIRSEKDEKGTYFGKNDYGPLEEVFNINKQEFDDKGRNRYVLALIVYEMITGQRFHDRRELDDLILERYAIPKTTMLSQNERLISIYGLEQLKKIERVLDREFSKNRKDRYQEDDELLTDLEACLTQSDFNQFEP